VHGLTTATSVWLSAAIGILCGGGLFVPGLFTTSIGVVYLRFAPRLSAAGNEESPEGDPEDSHEEGRRLSELGTTDAAKALLQPLNPKPTPPRDAGRLGTPSGGRSRSASNAGRDGSLRL